MLQLIAPSSFATALVPGFALTVPFATQAFSDGTVSTTTMSGQPLSQFQRATLSELRSGGPVTTVADVRGDRVNCFWTDESGQPNDATSPVKVLRKF
jgi:uncharacterized protein YodC (DUF2158 family)